MENFIDEKLEGEGPSLKLTETAGLKTGLSWGLG